MAKKYDGWIAKDKYGNFWYGTFSKNKEDVESYIKGKWKSIYNFKLIKIRLVEVSDD